MGSVAPRMRQDIAKSFSELKQENSSISNSLLFLLGAEKTFWSETLKQKRLCLLSPIWKSYEGVRTKAALGNLLHSHHVCLSHSHVRHNSAASLETAV